MKPSAPCTVIVSQLVIALSLSWAIDSHAMTPVGSPVTKIPLISNLSTWQALDQRRLVLSLNPMQNYLVTLSRSCHSLPKASHVGVSASNNTVYAGFDYITADGERCAIKAINRLSDDEKRALTSV